MTGFIRRRVTRSAVVALSALLLAGSVSNVGERATAETTSALARKSRAELADFTSWLATNRVKGAIGEVGWPGGADAARWNRIADAWYAEADRSGLWVTAWATGEWWGTGYSLTPYQSRHGGAVDSASPQARVVEAHKTTRRYLRGVNVAGGEFGVDDAFSNRNRGRYDQHYHYDSQATFNYLARRGVRLVRIPFRWERLQPTLNRPLNPEELARLRAVVFRARTAGLTVILDMHNYGRYRTSTGELTLGSAALRSAFADVWNRIAKVFKGRPSVTYGLMNEAHDLPGGARSWELASQAAVKAIRRAGTRKTILVGGYSWSGAQSWSASHRRAWIVDAAKNIRYEAHHYFDRDHSGRYERDYEQEEAAAARTLESASR